jgi:hypothetical protein
VVVPSAILAALPQQCAHRLLNWRLPLFLAECELVMSEAETLHFEGFFGHLDKLTQDVWSSVVISCKLTRCASKQTSAVGQLSVNDRPVRDPTAAGSGSDRLPGRAALHPRIPAL